MPAQPRRVPSLPSRIALRALLALYRRKGWQVDGAAPTAQKLVITGAPHTSNWDFLFFLGGVTHFGIRPSFMGKHTLFRWPMARFMRDMGGIAVNRSRRANYVAQVAEAFSAADELALVIAPEGSRHSDGTWRTGFYHIAVAAGVPIVPGWVDHQTMRGGLGPAIVPSGNLAADLAKIAAFYRSVLPDCPRITALERQAEELALAAGDETGLHAMPDAP